jgi:hypothetical protein
MKGIGKLWLLLVVLAYTSQGVAAVVLTCPAMAAAGNAAVDTADTGAMAHAGHHGAAKSPSASAPGDCCDGGQCKMSHCQLAAALPLDHHGASRKYTAPYPPAARVASPFHPADSLYRPPISR